MRARALPRRAGTCAWGSTEVMEAGPACIRSFPALPCRGEARRGGKGRGGEERRGSGRRGCYVPPPGKATRPHTCRDQIPSWADWVAPVRENSNWRRFKELLALLSFFACAAVCACGIKSGRAVRNMMCVRTSTGWYETRTRAEWCARHGGPEVHVQKAGTTSTHRCPPSRDGRYMYLPPTCSLTH